MARANGRKWPLNKTADNDRCLSSAVSVVCRVNATALLAFKVRNQKELDSIESEVTALIDRDTFREIWETATSEPYSFLFIRLNAKSLNETFMVRFEHKITFE